MRIGYVIHGKEQITYELMWERLNLSSESFKLYFVGFGIHKINPILYYKHNFILKNENSIVSILLER